MPSDSEDHVQASHLYPPPLRRRPQGSSTSTPPSTSPSSSNQDPSTSPPPPLPPRASPPHAARPPPPSAPQATLYDASPHLAYDRLGARRRLRAARDAAAGYTDPFRVVLLILLAGLVWLLSPWSSSDTFRPPNVVGLAGYPYPYRPVVVPAHPGGVAAPEQPSGAKAPPPPDSAAAASHACDCEAQLRRSTSSHHSTAAMPWQKSFSLPSRGKGCHLVQDVVNKEISDGLRGVKIGTLNLFLQHTSAALTVNENFDSDVRKDMDMAMDKIVPESFPWKHVDEGPDDSVSHTKASLFGPSITIPITDGRLNLGTWQSVYLCEWRRAKHARTVVATILP